jgi:hypothetical protein
MTRLKQYLCLLAVLATPAVALMALSAAPVPKSLRTMDESKYRDLLDLVAGEDHFLYISADEVKYLKTRPEFEDIPEELQVSGYTKDFNFGRWMLVVWNKCGRGVLIPYGHAYGAPTEPDDDLFVQRAIYAGPKRSPQVSPVPLDFRPTEEE